ncbi:MAG: formylglycine-generating enzyme family protein [Pseudomonadota bacterium]
MVLIPGGRTLVGTDPSEGYVGDGECPEREVMLRPFWMDKVAVTNAAFAAFIDATGFETMAEQNGGSFVFEGLLSEPGVGEPGPDDTPWWRWVVGACWRRPLGVGSNVTQMAHHPVVHVSWHDASAYAQWMGVRLPSEAEWETAARGGLSRKRFPWGNDLTPDGTHQMNIWQGEFPTHNHASDGYIATAPVDAFSANGFGLYNMTGNTWEWCADWFGIEHDPTPTIDPQGPALGDERVMRGGSYLCHDSYCYRYRVSARSASAPAGTTGHIGFRCAQDA